MIVRLGKRYGFTASHRLYSPLLSEAENLTTYGKCANPFGHGHNYEVEVTLKGVVDGTTGRAADLFALDRLVADQILVPFGYKDLNIELTSIPTTENLAAEVSRRLRAGWAEGFAPGGAVLEKIRIWETDRNICEVAESL